MTAGWMVCALRNRFWLSAEKIRITGETWTRWKGESVSREPYSTGSNRILPSSRISRWPNHGLKTPTGMEFSRLLPGA